MSAPEKSGREKLGQNIPQDVVQSVARGENLWGRIASSAKYIIASVTPSTWMSPQQPLNPLVPEPEKGAIARSFDFRVGQNLTTKPRAEENISFEQLRSLADSYDLMRLVIETRKDQIEAFEWEFVPKESGGEDKKADCKRATEFFMKPSFEHDWSGWLRAMMEDLLVIDTVCIYPRKTLGGELKSLDLVDGATIKRLIDEGGRTPMAPNPAYQQILKGIPATDYTTDELLYNMRNARTNRIYGLSPVEQVIMTVNIALRRQLHQLEYYTEGNVPEAIVGVHADWTADQIKEFQDQFDDMLAGNTAKRRRMTFVPAEAANMQFTREPNLKDQMDDWLARVVCFAFSIPPTAFISQVNRAVAETSDDAAKEEGLMPLLKWIKRRVDFITENVMEIKGVEFKWKMNDGLNPDVQAGIDREDMKYGLKSPDEIRVARGDDPLPNGMGKEPLVFLAGGVMTLKDALAAGVKAAEAAANPPAQPSGNPPVKGEKPIDEPKVAEPKAKKVEKAPA